MSVHGKTARILVIVVSASLLTGAFWFWDHARTKSEAVTVSRAEQEARRAAWQLAVEQRLATLPQPFPTLLLSMHRHEPQLGSDGAQYPLEPYTGISPDDGFYLYDLVRQVKPRRTAEVGFAEGFSTMYLLAALKSNGSGVHVAIDPYEDSLYHGIGLQKVKEAGMTKRFRFLPAKSIAGLPTLAAEAQPFEIIFIDGDHRFDSAFADFVLSDAICAKDGYIVLHDPWMKSISKVAAYIERNRADYARVPVPKGVNVVAFQKIGVDQRHWKHFADF
jgi:predicted O-methyltransferase YrrM